MLQLLILLKLMLLLLTGETGSNGTKNVEITVPLRYLSNFWRTLEMRLINCKVFLDLNWSEN